MRKILIIFSVFIVLTFGIPIIFTKSEVSSIEKKSKQEEIVVENKDDQKKKEEIKKEDYNYKEYNTIKLLHKKTNEIEEMLLDKYLLGVVSAEMPANFHIEALKAQALVARTYTIYSISNNNNKHGEAHICDDSTCCQAWISKDDRFSRWDENLRSEYWNKIEEAVNATKGKIITYNGEVIDAFFHSNSGGETEAPVNVWGGTNYPYLKPVETAGEDAYSQYSSEVTISKEELKGKIQKKHSNFNINYEEKDCIKVLEYTDAGRVKKIKIGNLNLSGVEVRTLIRIKISKF